MGDIVIVDINDPRLAKHYDELVEIIADAAGNWAGSHEELSQSERVALIIAVLRGGLNSLIVAYSAEIM